MECKNHRSGDSSGLRLPLEPGMLEAMRYIELCESNRLLAFCANNETMEKLSQLTEAYLCAQLERGFSTLDFYKSLLI